MRPIEEADSENRQEVDDVMRPRPRPRGVLRAVRDAALVKVNAKIVEYSMKDMNRMQRQIHAGLRDLGIEDFMSAQTVWPQEVTVTVRIDDPEMGEVVRATIEELVPAGVADIWFTDQPVARPYALPPEVVREPSPSTDPSVDERLAEVPAEPAELELPEEADVD